jgi:hypothetical protein
MSPWILLIFSFLSINAPSSQAGAHGCHQTVSGETVRMTSFANEFGSAKADYNISAFDFSKLLKQYS